MSDMPIGERPVVRALPDVLDALRKPEGPEHALLMRELNEAAKIICLSAMAGTGTLSPKFSSGLDDLLSYFANEDGGSDQFAETELEPAIMRFLTPCQKVIWAAGCRALASHHMKMQEA